MVLLVDPVARTLVPAVTVAGFVGAAGGVISGLLLVRQLTWRVEQFSASIASFSSSGGSALRKIVGDSVSTHAASLH